MTLSDLNKPAELTIWSSRNPAHIAQGRLFPTLRAALAVAAQAIDTGDARPWIITDAGDILGPNWIAYTSPVEAVGRRPAVSSSPAYADPHAPARPRHHGQGTRNWPAHCLSPRVRLQQHRVGREHRECISSGSCCCSSCRRCRRRAGVALLAAPAGRLRSWSVLRCSLLGPALLGRLGDRLTRVRGLGSRLPALLAKTEALGQRRALSRVAGRR